MKKRKKNLWGVLALIIGVSAISAYIASDDTVMAQRVSSPPDAKGPVTVRADLVQDKVLQDSEGDVVVSLTLSADQMAPLRHQAPKPADLVIVLDRSGSMQGQKMADARKAVNRLVDRLTAQDRLSLVSYSNRVTTHISLVPMDEVHRQKVKRAVEQIFSSGGTNLGGGLDQGIQAMMQAPGDDRHRKVILISDGLANQGVTDPNMLGAMASGAVEQNFTISTVGVGYDFNEVLMTTIADYGAGRYYFLENPNAFAQVFEKALQSTRNVAASSVELRVPLKDGIRLIHAGGYPIALDGDDVVIHPGDLLSGQDRKLFLTFKIPTNTLRSFDLDAFEINYKSNGLAYRAMSNGDLSLACIADKRAVMASIDQEVWEEQVVKEAYNQLKEEVASAIRKGQKEDAMVRIQAYEDRNRTANASVGSDKVSVNLDRDVQRLRQSVEETFSGAPAAVAEKKKMRSKALQYESYQIRRDKK